ncbi:MAG TPA: Gfo/Idh/MocA family oxidoreductase, partial [Chitinophagaceae bacterium]|nr:Gfo/Idh/MocA family oxidoreductase [Chitinophagaceae bacterium]
KVYSFHLNVSKYRPIEYYKKGRGKLFPDGGTLFTEFSTHIDLLLWLFGRVTEVKGIGKNINHKGVIDYEDCGTAALLMDNNILGGINWSVNATNNKDQVSLTIIAEKETVTFVGSDLHSMQLSSNNEYTYASESDTINTYDSLYEQFLKALAGDGTFTTAFDGLHTVETIEKIYESLGLPSYHSV